MRLIDPKNPANRLYVSDFVIEQMQKIPTIEAEPVKWIPVTERLPEIVKTTKAHRNVYRRTDRVLCACLQTNGKRMVKEGYAEFFNDYPEPNWKIPGTIHSVTHWMPLPEPPEDGGAENE